MSQLLEHRAGRMDGQGPAAPEALGPDRAEAIGAAALRAVAYADVFDFAMTIPELHRYLVGEAATSGELTALLAAEPRGPLTGRVSVTNGLATLPGRERLAALRPERRRDSARAWPVARRYARAVASLPFVRMVGITGGLAAGNSVPGADIDLMVVTETDHVWLTRAGTIALVRIAARDGHELCPNYFLAEHALELPDRDLYAAHELAQMVPIAGPVTYARARAANGWVRSYLPNAGGAPPTHGFARPILGPLRPLAERVLRTPFGRAAERWEQTRKIERFRALARASGSTGEAAFGPDRCKGHFEAHGARIREAYLARVRALGVEPRW